MVNNMQELLEEMEAYKVRVESAMEANKYPITPSEHKFIMYCKGQLDALIMLKKIIETKHL